MKLKTDIVVIGSGAGGASIAKELAAKGKRVLILERGSRVNRKKMGTSRTAVFDFYDRCALQTSEEGTIIYRALTTGGTTVVSCGNGPRALEEELAKMGIDLSEEYREVEKELNIKPISNKLIGKGSQLIMNAANRLGYDMHPMPKYIDERKCTSCGQCILGCKTGAKWSALEYVKMARKSGAKLINKIEVKSVVVVKGKAIGLVAKSSRGNIRIYAKKIIVSAGGIGTPAILKRSGINEAGNKLFGDLFNVTYGVLRDKHINLWREPTMAVLCTKFLKSKGFFISPFIDAPLVLRWIMSKRKQIKGFKYKDLLGIMVKTQDESYGKVMINERFKKTPTSSDMDKLNEGAEIAKRILIEAGVKKEDIIFTKPRAAHPGGSAAIGEVVNSDLETNIKNLFVCDASVLPKSSAIPPIVTIIALAKRLSKHIVKSSR